MEVLHEIHGRKKEQCALVNLCPATTTQDPSKTEGTKSGTHLKFFLKGHNQHHNLYSSMIMDSLYLHIL